MAADYLVAERETLEPERGGKKERCEKETKNMHKEIAEKISDFRGERAALKHFMSG